MWLWRRACARVELGGVHGIDLSNDPLLEGRTFLFELGKVERVDVRSRVVADLRDVDEESG